MLERLARRKGRQARYRNNILCWEGRSLPFPACSCFISFFKNSLLLFFSLLRTHHRHFRNKYCMPEDSPHWFCTFPIFIALSTEDLYGSPYTRNTDPAGSFFVKERGRGEEVCRARDFWFSGRLYSAIFPSRQVNWREKYHTIVHRPQNHCLHNFTATFFIRSFVRSRANEPLLLSVTRAHVSWHKREDTQAHRHTCTLSLLKKICMQ